MSGDGATWLIALAPLAAIVLVGYVKIAVVLSVLRDALGRAVPPRSVAALLALLLASFVMAPVLERAAPVPGASPAESAARADAPLREFLVAHTPDRERGSFLELARRLRPEADRAAVGERDLAVLAPAFVVAELKAAFQIGFLIYLPFLILDLVIASLLTALGMQRLDPRAVALPFKLLLFVLADGWNLLARGLVLGYT